MEEAAITLTGDQLRRFRDAVVSAYPRRQDLDQLLYFTFDHSLEHFAAAQSTLPEAVFEVLRVARRDAWLDRFIDAVIDDRSGNPELRRWTAECRWTTAQPPAPAPVPLPALDQQLVDSAFFDLHEIRDQIRAARRQAPGRVLGLSIRGTDMTVVARLGDWLPHCIGAVERKDLLSLSPDTGSVDARIKQVLGYLPDLASVNVVCPILTDGVPGPVLAAFWAGLRARLGPHEHWFVAIFAGFGGGPAAAAPLPPEVTELSPPMIRRSDLDDWAEQLVARLGWPSRLADAWSTLIFERCSDDGTLMDARRMFAAMDTSIREARFRRDEFRRQLEEWSERADAASR